MVAHRDVRVKVALQLLDRFTGNLFGGDTATAETGKQFGHLGGADLEAQEIAGPRRITDLLNGEPLVGRIDPSIVITVLVHLPLGDSPGCPGGTSGLEFPFELG